MRILICSKKLFLMGLKLMRKGTIMWPYIEHSEEELKAEVRYS